MSFAIPYLPFATVFGFVPLPVTLIVAIATITALYVVATELLKVEHVDRRIGTDPFADLTPDRRFPAVAAGRGEQSTPPSSGDAP